MATKSETRVSEKYNHPSKALASSRGLRPRVGGASLQGRQKDSYDHRLVEKKWQEEWDKSGIYYPDIESGKDPYYNLWMFPYPSAEGLHVGHAFTSTGGDIHGRFMRMNGKTVFQPTGYDSFGIHSENYALKIGENPSEVVKRTTKHYEEQLKSLGHGYDWTRTVTTSDPSYYKWTEWVFAELFKAGLAYRKKADVNWCPSCKTVLADEQVVTPKQAGKEPKDASGKLIDQQLATSDQLRVCERCATVVERKDLSQWFFRITDYAERLLENQKKIDWTPKVALAQKEWIGRSEGLRIEFLIFNSQFLNKRPKTNDQRPTTIPVWTKFWETVYGVTFIVVSPEYARENLVDLVSKENKESVSEYIKTSLSKSEQERGEVKEKSGVPTGIEVVNPVNGEKVPVFVADYVLAGVGTGAVMGVPAHDERDFDFAKKYALKIIQVVSYDDKDIDTKVANSEMAHEGEGKIVNSGKFDGLDAWGEGKEKMAEWMIKEGFGKWETNYHLRDWLISRQRYWGCPIPMIYCEKCAKEKKSYFTEEMKSKRNEEQKNIKNLKLKIKNSLIHQDQSDWEHYGWYPVPENELPVLLPNIKDWEPEGNGRGPLANHPEYYKVSCPECGAAAERETDVADTFLDSSWYFLRYPSVSRDSESQKQVRAAQNAKSVRDDKTGLESLPVSSKTNAYKRVPSALPWDPEITRRWLPVDLYFGGAEHAVLHLMYSRFITMVMNDLKYLSFDEPFPKFKANGLVIKDGAKMSKSRGNVINPDEYVEKYGADTLRMYLVFMGPMDGYPDFRDSGIEGMGRFIARLWKMFSRVTTAAKEDSEITTKMHQTIKKVTNDVANFNYNTAIAAIMEYVNLLNAKENYSKDYLEVLVKMLAPFVPHLAEEVWQNKFSVVGGRLSDRDKKHNRSTANSKQFESIHIQPWPKYEEKYLVSDKIALIVQVNGKLRATFEVDVDNADDKNYVLEEAKKLENVGKWLEGGIKKEIFVPGKLINFVV